MNILFYTNTQLNLKSLGGIETLNLNLAKYLVSKKNKIFVASICKKKFIKDKIIFLPINLLQKKQVKYKFDIIIGSNDTSLYSNFKTSKKILWFFKYVCIDLFIITIHL